MHFRAHACRTSSGSQKVTLPLVVDKGNGPMLFGRNRLRVMKLNWSGIHYVQAPGLQDVLTKYPEVFLKGLGTFKGPKDWLWMLTHLQGSARLGFCPMP